MNKKHKVDVTAEVVFSGVLGGMTVTGHDVTFTKADGVVRPKDVQLAAAISEHIKAIRALVDYYEA
jgi:hypothetical protein